MEIDGMYITITIVTWKQFISFLLLFTIPFSFFGILLYYKKLWLERNFDLILTIMLSLSLTYFTLNYLSLCYQAFFDILTDYNLQFELYPQKEAGQLYLLDRYNLRLHPLSTENVRMYIMLETFQVRVWDYPNIEHRIYFIDILAFDMFRFIMSFVHYFTLDLTILTM